MSFTLSAEQKEFQVRAVLRAVHTLRDTHERATPPGVFFWPRTPTRSFVAFPQALARNFAKTEMIPHAAYYDRTMEYPRAVFKKA